MFYPNLVHDLHAFDELRQLRVVVETPRGSNIKLKYDDKLGIFSLTRIMPLGVVYPYDFGFVPQTLAQDGDPIDVMVLIDAATYPGVVLSCRLLGALQIEERGMRGRPNHRLVAVPTKAARKEDLKDYAGLGERAQRELERFFIMATAFTSKDPQIRGWVGPEEADEMVHKAISRYRERLRRGSASPGRSAAAGGVSGATPAGAPALVTAADGGAGAPGGALEGISRPPGPATAEGAVGQSASATSPAATAAASAGSDEEGARDHAGGPNPAEPGVKG